MNLSTEIKKQFPIFTNHPDLVYLDNAATTQKPKAVINSLRHFQTYTNSNIHRGLYDIAATASYQYEETRTTVANFIGTKSNNIAFTKGTTESINFIANGWMRQQLEAGDNIVISAMEHHANLIPWQMVCKAQKAQLKIIPVTPKGELDWSQLPQLLDQKTKLVAITAISNTLGTINPIEEIIETAHQKNIPVLVDGAQATGLYPLNVTQLNCDFYTFSAHKLFGPFGVGVLFAKEKYHADIEATQFGGGMIESVSFDETRFLGYPKNLEAGTPNISGAIAFGEAIRFCEQFDQTETAAYIHSLATYAREQFKTLPVTIIGTPKKYSGIISFTMKNIHPHDIAQFLADANIAVRAGHHCTQPLLQALKVPATVRVSFSIYNNKEDIDQLVAAIKDIQKFWT